jgi:hypothetical protein
LIVGLFALGLWLPSFWKSTAVADPGTIEFSWQLIEQAYTNWPILANLTSIILIFLSGIVIQSAINKSDIRASMSLEPIFWCIGLNAFFLFSQNPIPILAANFFLTLAFRRLMSIGQQQSLFSVAFDSGLFIALASCFNSFYFMTIIVVWIAMGSTKSLTWREFLWSLLGMALPYYLIYSFHYLTDSQQLGILADGHVIQESLSTISWLQGLFLSLSALLFLWSFRNTFAGLATQSILKRKLTWISSSLLVLCAFIAVFNWFSGSSVMALCTLSIPMCLFLINLFPMQHKTLIPDIITSLWIVAAMLMSIIWVVQN